MQQGQASMPLQAQSVTEFAALLASDAPFPGGGGASALTGALAAALCSMVANLTVGRKKYAASEADMRDVLKRADALRNRLLLLIDEDAEGFKPLAAAYAIPKDDPARAAVMEGALNGACKAPKNMMLCCAETIELLETLLAKGSALVISDVAVGAALARAALVSASMNIFVNTGSMQDSDTKRILEQEADALLNEFMPRADQVERAAYARIRREE